MIAKRYEDGRYSVCSANGILVIQLPKAEAISALRALGLSEDRAIAVLDRKVSHAEWVSTFGMATAALAAATAETVESLPDVEDVRQRQAELAGAVAELQNGVNADRRNQERRELEAWLNARAEQMIEVSILNGVSRTSFLENKVWELLWQSPEGKRLEALRED